MNRKTVRAIPPASTLSPVATTVAKTAAIHRDYLERQTQAHRQFLHDQETMLRRIASMAHSAHKTSFHPALPLSRFSGESESAPDQVTIADRVEPIVDMDRLRRHWCKWTGKHSWPGEHIYMALVARFLRRFHVEIPSALEAVSDRPVLFLANHQVAIESLVFAVTAAVVQGRPVVTIAKAEHKKTWLGQLITLCQEFPGVRMPRAMMYFDREDRASMLDLLREAGHLLSAEGLSLMVHVDGTRARHCRRPVEHVSSALLDLAVKARLPVVPVRFCGGLPIEPAPYRLEFPLGFTCQDIHLGVPIMPEDLDALHAADRRDLVRDAINRTGPRLDSEIPHKDDPVFARAVTGLADELRLEVSRAVALQCLCEWEAAGEFAADLIKRLRTNCGAPFGASSETQWLERLLSWFRSRD